MVVHMPKSFSELSLFWIYLHKCNLNLVELLSDDIEKDDSGSEEESNKEDGEYNMPNSAR